MDSEFAIDEELRQLDELNEKYFRLGYGLDFEKRVNLNDTQDNIKRELADSLKNIRRNHLQIVEQERSSLEQKIRNLSMSGEQALRKFSDVENKSLKIAQEKELLAAELKNEREAHRSELEHLRGSGDFLRKSVTSMQTQINQATSESFELKFNYDEMFRNLDGFKRELRRISENLSLKSKEKNKFKNLHEESANKESELQKQSLAMQMEILELTAACKQLQSENNFLRSQASSTGDILGHTLESLNGYLRARSEAGSLVQETQAVNAQLKQANQKLETRVRVLEEELASTKNLLQTSNQAFQETRHAVENQISGIRAYSQLYDAVDSSLYSILQESQKAISEATKAVSPTFIHELQKQIAGLTNDLQASNHHSPT